MHTYNFICTVKRILTQYLNKLSLTTLGKVWLSLEHIFIGLFAILSDQEEKKKAYLKANVVRTKKSKEYKVRLIKIAKMT